MVSIAILHPSMQLEDLVSVCKPSKANVFISNIQQHKRNRYVLCIRIYELHIIVANTDREKKLNTV